MNSTYTVEECMALRKICSIVIDMQPKQNKIEEIEELKKVLPFDDETTLSIQMRGIGLWCLSAVDLYCHDKKDILRTHFGTDWKEIRPEDKEWYLGLNLRPLRHKLHETDKKPARKLYISDMHFYHHSLNKQMDCRGFDNYQKMNAYMIQRWNEKVTKKDEVYILGDFSIAKGIATNEILKQLNGKLYFIVGNHDRFLNDPSFDTSRFQWVKNYAEIHDDSRLVILSHYPMFCCNGQYRRKDGAATSYMLYGHVHNTQDERLVDRFIKETRNTLVMSKYDAEPRAVPCQMINCFCMFSDYQPLTLDEWIETDAKRRAMLDEEG